MTILFLYHSLQRSWKGGILFSPCRSVLLSVCGQNRVRSVSSTILVGSISYLHILSGHIRRCFACNVYCKIKKNKILANSLNLLLWLCILLTWDPIWLISMGNHEAVGVSSEWRRSNCSSYYWIPNTDKTSSFYWNGPQPTGPLFTKKTPSYQYRDSHYKPETVVRPS